LGIGVKRKKFPLPSPTRGEGNNDYSPLRGEGNLGAKFSARIRESGLNKLSPYKINYKLPIPAFWKEP